MSCRLELAKILLPFTVGCKVFIPRVTVETGDEREVFAGNKKRF